MKGAPGHILRAIAREGRISMLRLASSTGYSLSTVCTTIRQLERAGHIRVERAGPGRSNVYQVGDHVRI